MVFDPEEYLLEQAREQNHKKKKYGIPDKIIIWSVNDLT